MICTGFGHRCIAETIDEKLYGTVTELIKAYDVQTFIVGESGDFDAALSRAVRIAKKDFPHVRLSLILPYFSNRLNENKDYYEEFYDNVVCYDAFESCYYKAAFSKRNRWMIDCSDYVISYIREDVGGAYSAFEYAKKQGKPIILV